MERVKRVWTSRYGLGSTSDWCEPLSVETSIENRSDHTCNDMRITHSYFSFRCFELGSLAAKLRIQWPDGKWLELRVYLPNATKITIELTASDAMSRLLGKAVKPAQPKIKSLSQCSICVTGWTADDCPLGCEKPQG